MKATAGRGLLSTPLPPLSPPRFASTIGGTCAFFSRRHCSRPPPSPLPTPLKLCGPPTGLTNIMYNIIYNAFCTLCATADGGRAETPAGGGHPGGCYSANGHICLRYGGKEDTVRREPQRTAPTWRQGRRMHQQFFKAETTGVGFEMCIKYPGGPP
jgi:hypothetical protein